MPTTVYMSNDNENPALVRLWKYVALAAHPENARLAGQIDHPDGRLSGHFLTATFDSEETAENVAESLRDQTQVMAKPPYITTVNTDSAGPVLEYEMNF